MCNPSQDFHGSNPTLSPTAQAVLDAVREICPAPADEIAAAAIRELVSRTKKRKVLKTLGVPMVYSKEYCLVEDLLAIADELDGSANE